MRFFIVVFLLYFSLLFPPEVFAEQIVINEFIANPNEGNEWVEFYHPEGVGTLASYFFDDDTNFFDDIGSQKLLLSDIVTIGSYSYVEVKSYLNNTGDFVVLFDASGTIVDQYEYKKEQVSKGVTIGRSPDGTGSFDKLAMTTKGSANSPLLPTATLTPTKTPTPTKVPTATKVPTPIKSGQASAKISMNAKTSASSREDFSDETDTLTANETKDNTFSYREKTASIGARPTAILGASVSAKQNASQSAARKKVAVLGESAKQNTNVTSIFFVIGAILLIGCGILLYLKKRRSLL